METVPSTISPFKRLPAEVAIEPIYNVLNSLALLSATAQAAQYGPLGALIGNWNQLKLNDWVAQTVAALTAERRHTNRLLFEGLRDALAPDREWSDFSTYLEHLTAQNPFALRDRMLQRMSQAAPGATAVPAALLADAQSYSAQVERLHPGAASDPAIIAEAHGLLNNPPAMHDLIVAHLDQIWETTLAAEWGRATGGRIGMLQSQVNVFQHCLGADIAPGSAMSPYARPNRSTALGLSSDATVAEAFRAFTGYELPAYVQPPAGEVRQIIFVPSPHNGRYVSTWYNDGVLRLFFSAPPNYAYLMRTSTVGLSELRARVDALADETRLRILELIARHGELSAQELITRLELTQSSVSRHLKHLGAYLIERRGEGANKHYSLKAIDMTITIRALERLLAGETTFVEQQEAKEEHAERPEEIRKFLDFEGRITRWPEKMKEQPPLLAYLAAKFEPGRSYTEKEVNAIILEQITFKDYVTLRRALVDFGFVGREIDGSRYWLIEQTA